MFWTIIIVNPEPLLLKNDNIFGPVMHTALIVFYVRDIRNVNRENRTAIKCPWPWRNFWVTPALWWVISSRTIWLDGRKCDWHEKDRVERHLLRYRLWFVVVLYDSVLEPLPGKNVWGLLLGLVSGAGKLRWPRVCRPKLSYLLEILPSRQTALNINFLFIFSH